MQQATVTVGELEIAYLEEGSGPLALCLQLADVTSRPEQR